jgi:hypothetical protein
MEVKARRDQEKTEEASMYRLTVLYPSGPDKHFDVDYYRDKHIPMVEGFIGDDVIRSEISWGTAGAAIVEVSAPTMPGKPLGNMVNAICRRFWT